MGSRGSNETKDFRIWTKIIKGVMMKIRDILVNYATNDSVSISEALLALSLTLKEAIKEMPSIQYKDPLSDEFVSKHDVLLAIDKICGVGK